MESRLARFEQFSHFPHSSQCYVYDTAAGKEKCDNKFIIYNYLFKLLN